MVHTGLDADADQFVCDERRVRPLHLAAAVSDRRRSLRTCIALLESGCDAQCADYEGRTCLHVVAERGPRGLVELLMDAGCSKEALDRALELLDCEGDECLALNEGQLQVLDQLHKCVDRIAAGESVEAAVQNTWDAREAVARKRLADYYTS